MENKNVQGEQEGKMLALIERIAVALEKIPKAIRDAIDPPTKVSESAASTPLQT